MGIDVEVQGEFGDRFGFIGDPRNLLWELLPRMDDRTFACLRFVDPYGNTVFNRAQAEEVEMELERLAEDLSPGESLDLLIAVAELARKVQSEPHLYLWFIGD